MKLPEEAYRWAINHLFKESDTDLFPRPYELKIVHERADKIINKCKEIDIGSYKWKASRRFVVPKDNISYRVATQLDIMDSIMLGAIIYHYGNLIESNRIPEADDTVFSYRFKPKPDGTLYSNQNAWNRFWESCKETSKYYKYVVMCDISDFYNQIYHHTVENQLIACGFPNEILSSIVRLISDITQKNSRGIPVGPHAFHIIAEAALTPVDESLHVKGVPFKRYVDDFVLFCKTEKEARIRINQMAEILDKQQRLVMQNQKTHIYTKQEFADKCKQMLVEEPKLQIENELIQIINSYTSGDAYAKINISEIKDEDLRRMRQQDIIDLLNSHLKGESPNYEKIRWLYRRLAQIGLPTAIEYSVENFDALVPALNDVCLYINSCAQNYTSDWKKIGDYLIEILEDEIIESNDFYKISLLNLFVYNPKLNHFSTLIKMYKTSSPSVKREILLASMNYKSASWIRELKEQFNSFDSWQKRSYLVAAKNLPPEERTFFFKTVNEGMDDSNIIEKEIISWSKS